MKRKRFCKSIGLFIILLLTGCSQSKTEEVFYQTSPLTIFEDGFGLSAEEFFSLSRQKDIRTGNRPGKLNT